MKKFLILMALVLVAGCHRNEAESEGTAMPAQKVTTAEGLMLEDLQVGTGVEAVSGKKIKVHYTGWLVNGTKFDSSVDRNEPFEFVLGAGSVIQGWDKGFGGMKVGGKRKLTIPPELGYGKRAVGSGLIPANSTLIFDVELLGVN